MDVTIPHDLDPDVRADLLTRERQRALELHRSGVWPHLWRVAGLPANISVLDVGTPDELHELLTSLPLYPYLTLRVTALATHPSRADRSLDNRTTDQGTGPWTSQPP